MRLGAPSMTHIVHVFMMTGDETVEVSAGLQVFRRKM
jgi:hypothetical protein